MNLFLETPEQIAARAARAGSSSGGAEALAMRIFKDPVPALKTDASAQQKRRLNVDRSTSEGSILGALMGLRLPWRQSVELHDAQAKSSQARSGFQYPSAGYEQREHGALRSQPGFGRNSMNVRREQRGFSSHERLPLYEEYRQEMAYARKRAMHTRLALIARWVIMALLLPILLAVVFLASYAVTIIASGATPDDVMMRMTQLISRLEGFVRTALGLL
ncbi:hypothetical protein K6V98_04830 [Collinsella sp. AGMB00827]|uniref:Uncharacterized protein n=1 Tax=Collinsella ureilytica TaxID=2869515 RepID=A0ABS7MKR3_9ACTN|nr:hypothetical protein [Collinsella urealyticum]MBY4797680.1 hypothetical protein [Collinsella urealyticum]